MTSRVTSIAHPQIASTSVVSRTSSDRTMRVERLVFHAPGRRSIRDAERADAIRERAAQNHRPGDARPCRRQGGVQMTEAIGRNDHVAVDEEYMRRAVVDRRADTHVHPG